MPNNTKHIAVIGAGLSGAIVTQLLTQAGHQVSVFEKSRGTGGRLSSCRLGELSADLGAPYFDCNDEALTAWLAQQPNMTQWTPNVCDFLNKKVQSQSFWVATTRQSQLTRQLINDATLVSSTRVGYIWPETENDHHSVLLRDEHGKALGHFDAAVVATPAQQAAPLLEALPRFSQKAAQVDYSVSWVMVLETDTELSHMAEVILNADNKNEHAILARCTKDSAKPQRNASAQVWVLEASANWSWEYQDQPKEWITEQLLSAFSSLCDTPINLLQYRAHRWLYARHETPEDTTTPYLWDEDARIGACGDWLCDGQLDAAWHSANALIEAINK